MGVLLLALLFAPGPDDTFRTIEKLILSGDHRQALEQLNRLPATPHRHLLASKAYDGLNDPAAAVREAEAALALDPRSEAAHLQLGQIFLGHNTPQAAFEIYSEALGLIPDSFFLRLGRGIALKQLSRYDEAEQDLIRCLRRNPSHSLAFDALATVYLHSKRFDEASTLAIAFRSGQPNDFRGAYFLAAAREGLRAPLDDIEPLLRESIQLNPNFAASYALLGKLKLNDNQPAAAIPLLERAVSLRPDYSPALLHLAQAYQKSGRQIEADRAFENLRSLKLKENSPAPALRYRRGQR